MTKRAYIILAIGILSIVFLLDFIGEQKKVQRIYFTDKEVFDALRKSSLVHKRSLELSFCTPTPIWNDKEMIRECLRGVLTDSFIYNSPTPAPAKIIQATAYPTLINGSSPKRRERYEF